MKKSGIYRSIYSRLPDDLDFRKLSPDARLLFYTMRISRICNLPGIFVFENGEITTLAEQTGLGLDRIRELLSELEAGRWIVYRSPILWIINALRHDPGIKLETNEKQKKGIISVVANLPKLPIVTSFLHYYNLPVSESYPQKLPGTARMGNMTLNFSANDSLSRGYREGIDTLKTPPSPPPTTPLSSPSQKQEQEQEQKRIASGESVKNDNNNDGTYGIQVEEIVFLLISQFGVEVDTAESKKKAFTIAGKILKLAKEYPDAVVAIKRAQRWVPAGGEFFGAVRLELRRRADGWRDNDWEAVKAERKKFDKLLEQKFPGKLGDVLKTIGGGQIGKE